MSWGSQSWSKWLPAKTSSGQSRLSAPDLTAAVWKMLLVLLVSVIIAQEVCLTSVSAESSPVYMSHRRKSELRDQVKDMFLHGYNSYIKYAYPADELMPLSCKGRYRSHGSGRGDVDDAMGNFSMTLVDSLDSLVLLNEIGEFERVVRLVIDEVRFDSDIVVSVFETNIRMLGGLISAHVLAKDIQEKRGKMVWYKDEMLTMAWHLGYILLEAFNSTTGMPYPRVNLRHGMKDGLSDKRHTCSACAGTMILEFATLSRLTGDAIFEEKARLAMDYLWHKRHSHSSLLGHIIDVHSGDWIRRESGIGAGSDSYYEYVLKAYILLGDDTYLHRFHRHYEAISKYVLKGSRMLDVHMHQPSSSSKHYLDSLIAFFPGLQVLYGDIQPAKLSYETLHKVVKRYKFLPEAFTPEPELRMYWAESYLRPEFIESTYFLYTATKDPLYLHIGEQLINSLEEHSRVQCGYAALKDTRSGLHDDRMDSFFLAETLKYLYLLFSDPADIPIDLKDYLFTTEAHLLPLHLSRKNVTFFPQQHLEERVPEESPILSCPASRLDADTLWAKIVEPKNSDPFSSEHAAPEVYDQCGGSMQSMELSPELEVQMRRQRERSMVASDIDWANQDHVSGYSPVTSPYRFVYDEYDIIVPVFLLTMFICTQVRLLFERGSSVLSELYPAVRLCMTISPLTGRIGWGFFCMPVLSELLFYCFLLKMFLKSAFRNGNPDFHVAIVQPKQIFSKYGAAVVLFRRRRQGAICAGFDHLGVQMWERSLKNRASFEKLCQVMILAEMGISLTRRSDGSMLISQDTSQAKGIANAAEGIMIMQEMIQTSRSNVRPSELLALVKYSSAQANISEKLNGSPAQFGPSLSAFPEGLSGVLGFAMPESGCFDEEKDEENEVDSGNQTEKVIRGVEGKIAVVIRGGCMFVEKARNVEKAGAIGMIVLDNKKGTMFSKANAFAMSGDDKTNDVKFPSVFLADREARVLVDAYASYPDLVVTLSG